MQIIEALIFEVQHTSIAIEDRNLQNLSTTSHFVRQLCLPYLYHTIGFYSVEGSRRLFAVLDENPELMQYVREVVISSCVFPYTAESPPDPLLFDKLCELGRSIGPGLEESCFKTGDGFFRHPDAVERLSPFVRHAEHLDLIFWENDATDFEAQEHLLSCTTNLHSVFLRFFLEDEVSPVDAVQFTSSTPLPSTLRLLEVYGHAFTPQSYATMLTTVPLLESLDIEQVHFSVAGLDAFVDSICGIGNSLTTLKVKYVMNRNDTIIVIDQDQEWTSCMVRIIRSCTRLSTLEIASIFCGAELIEALPSTLRHLHIEGVQRDGHGDGPVPARLLYDKLCTAILNLRAKSLEVLDICHGYDGYDGVRDGEVEAALRKKIETVRFRCSWPLHIHNHE